MTGKTVKEETKKKLSAIHKGKPKSEAHKKKLSIAAKNRAPASEETKKKISESQKGRKHLEETKKKLRKVAKNRPKITCPHCGKIGGAPQMKQWHFDNCKIIGIQEKFKTNLL